MVGDTFLHRQGRTLSDLRMLAQAASELLPSERAVVFTTNHDTERASAIWYADGSSYELANVFVLAFPYGYPSLLSSYAFDRETQAGRDQGPPSDEQGNTISVYDASGQAAGCDTSPRSWICEHRARSSVNMIGFRKISASAANVTDFWDDGENQIAFGRGDKGFVVINGADTALDRVFQTSLSPGTYCEILQGDFAANGCGPTIFVDDRGQARISVGAQSAVAIHVGARP
jgi:alpha-amylase